MEGGADGNVRDGSEELEEARSEGDEVGVGMERSRPAAAKGREEGKVLDPTGAVAPDGHVKGGPEKNIVREIRWHRR